MGEQLVSFQVAKLAKEKGFNLDNCKHYLLVDFNECDIYNIDQNNLTTGNLIGYSCGNKTISAPSQSLLQKWIREVHKIYVTALPSYTDNSDNKKHYFELFYGKTLRLFGKKYSYFPTYEEALEIGLFEALNLIKNE